MSTPQSVLDRAGFPMIWVEAINAYIHWLPVTKIQIEYFLCSTGDSHFDERWYERLRDLNPRITPADIHDQNYWQALLTGILPHEAQHFTQWCGPEYRLPTLNEWLTAYRALKEQPALPDPLRGFDSLRERVRLLLEQLESAGRTVSSSEMLARTRADQILMRLGVMEWVDCREQRTRWGGMGKPAKRFRGLMFNPDHGQPHELLDPELERASYYGLRLIRRA